LYFKGSTSDPEGQIEALLRQGQFDEALKAATTYLRANPDNSAMAGLWLDSFANSIGRNWLPNIDRRQFNEADQTLQEVRVAHSDRSETDNFVDLLAWVTRLEKFLYERETQPKLKLYQDEYEIHRLLDDWNQNKPRYQAAMNDLSRRSALFQSRVAEQAPLSSGHERSFATQRPISIPGGLTVELPKHLLEPVCPACKCHRRIEGDHQR